MHSEAPIKDTTTYIRRLERLLDASRLLNSTLELSELTEIVFRIVQDEVGMERCTLFVLDRRHDVLRSFIAQGVEKSELKLAVGQGLAGTVAATGEIVDVEHPYQDDRFYSRFDETLGFRTKDVLAMPIFNRQGDVIGVLQLLNRSRPLDDRDKDFLSNICTYIGMAVHNAWTHRQLLESRNIEQEFRMVSERLGQAEKRSALGELVAGIIHEMKNPLTVALGQCAMLRERADTSDDAARRIEKIESSIHRALKIAGNFLSFARERGNESVPTDVNAIVMQTVDLLTYELRRSGIAVALDLETLPSIKADPGKIQQVLLNLLRNAEDAMRDRNDERSIRIRSTHDRQKEVIRIEVKDRGEGIPAHLSARIFEPFFTTKTKGLGTGLGLAVSKRLVEEHRGRLSFVSTPQEGSIFQIELPIKGNSKKADLAKRTE